MRRLSALSLVFALIPVFAHGQAEPFGIRMGMSASELKRLTGAVADTSSLGAYHSERVPAPNGEFEQYGFLIAPSTGLCKVWATGKTIENDAYGSALRARFRDLTEVLDQKYGPHETQDFLNSGSIWSEPREWMMSLSLKERTFSSYWGIGENKGKPPAPVEDVVLSAKALDRNSGWISLAYEFSNEDKCFAELTKLRNSSL